MAGTFRTGIEVDSYTEIVAQMTELGANAADLDRLALGTHLAIEEDVQLRFKSSPPVRAGGGVWGGANWMRLGEAYLKQSPHREGGKILIDTGELKKSFTLGGAGNIAESDTSSITFGSSLPKAAGLQGDRPIIFSHPALIADITDRWETVLMEVFDQI